ncbi:cytochrome C [Aliiglaciecola sp. NS0011-25]|uniref:cytochrome C n=1 Tax=Aliiglaciecola sp. NS0011-25 TaxID=3127654 RepID=UPI00310B948F
MKKHLSRLLWFCCLFGFTCNAEEAINEARALFNYQMLCQGCHVGDGSGGKDVPNMNGAVGIFLNSAEGREYLIKVPGAANSALDNKELAELMNWMLPIMGKDSVPDDFVPYTEQEVETLRQEPLMEVVEHRAKVLNQIITNSTSATTIN